MNSDLLAGLTDPLVVPRVARELNDPPNPPLSVQTIALSVRQAVAADEASGMRLDVTVESVQSATFISHLCCP